MGKVFIHSVPFSSVLHIVAIKCCGGDLGDMLCQVEDRMVKTGVASVCLCS